MAVIRNAVDDHEPGIDQLNTIVDQSRNRAAEHPWYQSITRSSE